MTQNHSITDKRDMDRALRQNWLSENKRVLRIAAVLAVLFCVSVIWALTPSDRSSPEPGTIASLSRAQTQIGRGDTYATVRLQDGSKVSLPLSDDTLQSGDQIEVCAYTKRFVWQFVTYRQCPANETD